MNDYQIIVESDIQTFIDNYDTRPIDLNIENYERNIVFLGCSLTYGAGVDNKNTYPSKLRELSDNKWNCINLGIYGGSLDMAYLIFNKIKHLDIAINHFKNAIIIKKMLILLVFMFVMIIFKDFLYNKSLKCPKYIKNRNVM